MDLKALGHLARSIAQLSSRRITVRNLAVPALAAILLVFPLAVGPISTSVTRAQQFSEARNQFTGSTMNWALSWDASVFSIDDYSVENEDGSDYLSLSSDLGTTQYYVGPVYFNDTVGCVDTATANLDTTIYVLDDSTQFYEDPQPYLVSGVPHSDGRFSFSAIDQSGSWDGSVDCLELPDGNVLQILLVTGQGMLTNFEAQQSADIEVAISDGGPPVLQESLPSDFKADGTWTTGETKLIVDEAALHLNAWWPQQFVTLGIATPFTAPGHATYSDAGPYPCGQTAPLGNFYCLSDRTVYISLERTTSRIQAYGPTYGMATVFLSMAHEYGHHVIQLVHPTIAPTDVLNELVPDCLGGAFYSSQVSQGTLALPALDQLTQEFLNSLGDPEGSVVPYPHGTGPERAATFLMGATVGVTACGLVQ